MRLCDCCYIFLVVLEIYCQHKDDPNVCPRYTRVGVEQHLVLECCPDYYLKEELCIDCKAGTFGKACSEKCINGYYGLRCLQTCTCGPNAECDPVIGCVCRNGWAGFNCTEKCKTGTFGTDCSFTCSSGYYGEQCSHKCNCNSNEECDVIYGCVCQEGWTGINCTERYNMTTFSFAISETTSYKKESQLQSANQAPIIASAVTSMGILFIIFVSFGLVFYFKKHRPRAQNGNIVDIEDAHGYDEINPYQEISLEHFINDVIVANPNSDSSMQMRRWSLPALLYIEGQRTESNQIFSSENYGRNHILYCSLRDYESTRVYEKIYSLPRSRSCGYIYMHPYAVVRKTTSVTNVRLTNELTPALPTI